MGYDDLQFDIVSEEDEMEDVEGAMIKQKGFKRPPKPGTRKQPNIKRMKPPRGMSASLGRTDEGHLRLAARVADRWVKLQSQQKVAQVEDEWDLLDLIESEAGIAGTEWEKGGHLRWYIEGRRRGYIDIRSLLKAIQSGYVDLRDHVSASSQYMKILKPHIQNLGVQVRF